MTAFALLAAGFPSQGRAAERGKSSRAAAPSVSPGIITTTPRSLSLALAKRIAFERNWDLLAAKSNVDLAVAQKIVSLEFPNPTFAYNTMKISATGGANVSGTPQGNGIWERNYDTIAAVTQLVEIGKRSVRQASATAGLQAAEATFKDARRTLDLGVTKAYIAAVLAETNVGIIHQTMESLQHEAKIAETRLAAGDISTSDKAQIEIAAARAELDAEAAINAAKAARIAVEVLLGSKNPQGDWSPSDNLQKMASEEQVKGIAQPRPDLVAAEASYKKSIQDRKLQEAMRIPDPTFQVQYEHNPPDQTNTVGFGVSFPLPIWNQNGGNIKAAKAAEDSALAQVGKVQTQVASDISVAEAAWHEAVMRWHRYEGGIKPRSAEVLKTISYSYQKGGASLLDLLSAERDDNDIRLATAQAIADSATASATLANVKNITPGSAPAETPSPKSHATSKK